jgi:hypothetical protein
MIPQNPQNPRQNRRNSYYGKSKATSSSRVLQGGILVAEMSSTQKRSSNNFVIRVRVTAWIIRIKPKVSKKRLRPDRLILFVQSS